MKRFVFLVGAAIGFVLGSRAGRARYDQLAAAARSIAESEPVRRGAGRLSHGADVLFDRVRVAVDPTLHRRVPATEHGPVHTTESLRQDLIARYESLGLRAEEIGRRLGESFDAARDWVESGLERNREKAATNVVAFGDLRDDALLDFDDDHLDDGTGHDRRTDDDPAHRSTGGDSADGDSADPRH